MTNLKLCVRSTSPFSNGSSYATVWCSEGLLFARCEVMTVAGHHSLSAVQKTSMRVSAGKLLTGFSTVLGWRRRSDSGPRPRRQR